MREVIPACVLIKTIYGLFFSYYTSFSSCSALGEMETDNYMSKEATKENKPKSKTLSYEEYQRITVELVHHVHQHEVREQATAVETG